MRILLETVARDSETEANGPWSKGARLVEGHLIYPGAVIRDGVIHLVFCGWNPAAAIYENVFYLRSRDGGETWTRGDDVRVEVPHRYDVTDPRSVEALDRVSRAHGEGGFESSAHDLQVLADRQGRPHVTYFYVPAYFPRPGRFPRTAIVHARREAGGWKRDLLSSDPSVDVGWASLLEDERTGALHGVVCYRESTRKFADLGYLSSPDSGDTCRNSRSLRSQYAMRRRKFLRALMAASAGTAGLARARVVAAPVEARESSVLGRARMAIDPRGAIHVAGLKGRSIVRVRIDPGERPSRRPWPPWRPLMARWGSTSRGLGAEHSSRVPVPNRGRSPSTGSPRPGGRSS